MDIGFKNAGFSILAANELDPHACQTYRTNLSESRLLEADIDICIDELSAYRGVDVVFGGPPCQGFSVAGKMDPNDPRSKLVFSFVDVVEKLAPRSFVMENVKALGKLSKFSKVREALMQRFLAAGYNVSMHILNSREFGVPQSRERVFFIGTKKPARNVLRCDLEQFEREPPTLREAIGHLGRAGEKSNSRICNAKITLATKPVLRRSPYAGMLFNGQGRPLNPDGWSSTLPASMGGNRTPIVDEEHLYDHADSWVEMYHSHLWEGGKPWEMKDAPQRLRRLTIDESMVLQTFPADYQFEGPQSKIFSQLGNAVPCDLAKAVASALREALVTLEPSKQRLHSPLVG